MYLRTSNLSYEKGSRPTSPAGFRRSLSEKGSRPTSPAAFRRSLSEKDVDSLQLQLSTFYTAEEDEEDSRRANRSDPVPPEGGVAGVVKLVTQSPTANWFKDSASFHLGSSCDLDDEEKGSKESSRPAVSEHCNEHHGSASSGSSLSTLQLSRSRSPSMRDLNRTKVTSMLVSPKTDQKSKSLPRLTTSPWMTGKPEVLYENYLNLAKIRQNDKRMMRKHWIVSWAVLTEMHLSFFKDSNYHNSRPIKPELLVELVICRVEWTKKLSSRDNVFLISSTSPSVEILCQSNSESDAQNWFCRIQEVIRSNRKTCKTKLEEDSVQRRYVGSSSLTSDFRSTMTTMRRSSKKLAITPEPKEPKKSSNILSQLFQRLNRRPPLAITPEPKEPKESSNTKSQLRQLLNHRPPRQDLEAKDGAVFGCTVEELTKREKTTVPIFMEKCIGVIEGNEENLKADGIYSASGNLSLIQKIRLQVDQNNLDVLDKEDDIHVLTGALKLFLREMRDPLVPTDMFDNFLKASQLQSAPRLEQLKKLIAALPKPNYFTLKYLFQHLLKVSQFSQFNQIQIPNLATIFGPTVMWSPSESSSSMGTELMHQNFIVENLLTDFHSIFLE